MKDTLAHVADTLATAIHKLEEHGHQVAANHGEEVELTLQALSREEIGMMEIGLNVLAPISVILLLSLWYGGRNRILIRRKLLGILAGLVFFFGFLLYSIGFYDGGTKESLLALFLRAALSSIEMFASHSDLIEVRHACHESVVYMISFTIVHFMAVSLSLEFLLQTFLYKGMVKRRLRKRVKKAKKVFIFWGVSEISTSLAKIVNSSNRKDDYLILFFKLKKDAHKAHKEGFLSFLSASSITVEDIEMSEKVNGLVFYSNNEKTSRDYFEKHLENIFGKDKYYLEGAEIEKVENELELKFKENCDDEELNIAKEKYRTLLRENKGSKFSIFILSENEGDNLVELDRLLRSEFVESHRLNISFYCQAHKDAKNVSFVRDGKSNTEIAYVDLIDTSLLAIQSLKLDQNQHPINFVEHNDEGIVTSEFNSLILGFGDTAKEALAYLYEYGAFIGEDGNRSKFHCTIIDKNIEIKKGTYLSQRPALKDCDLLTFENLGIGTADYWQKIETIADKLNYVIIAMGEDRLNISTAIDLFNYCYRKREGKLDNFAIYIRLHKDSNLKFVKKIINYYKVDNNEYIRVFGTYESIFIGSTVAKYHVKQRAEEFYSDYETIKSEDLSRNTWEERAIKERALSQNHICAYNSLRRKEFQDFSKAYHIYTKMKLMGIVDDIEKVEEYMKKGFKFDAYGTDVNGNVCYGSGELVEDAKLARLLTNVAKLEHLRWVSSHEVMGYEGSDEINEEENEITKKLVRLAPWDKLVARWEESGRKPELEYRQYDYLVVNTSIRLYYKVLKYIQEKQQKSIG